MIYLHIGTGKAGSSTIQSFLKENKNLFPYSQVVEFGIGNAWRIAAASKTCRSYSYWVEKNKILSDAAYQELSDGFWSRVRAEVSYRDSEDYVASSEYIYGQLGDNIEAMARLRDELEDIFGKVKIIIYLRDQVSFVKSFYAQMVKGPARWTMSFEDYLKNLDALHVPYHYAQRILLWGKVFGFENIEPIVFHPQNFPNENLIEDFLNRVNIPDHQQFARSSAGVRNKSPSYLQLEILRFFNNLPAQGGRLRRIGYSLLAPIVPDRDFSKSSDRKILQLVTEGNKWLNEKYFADSTVKLPELKC